MTTEQREQVISLIGDIKEANLLDVAYAMLSALKHVEQYLSLNSIVIEADRDDLLEDIRAAIAKAEGRS